MITKFEHKGRWKLPKSEIWINGTLSFDPISGAQLELFGSFNKHIFDRASKEVIQGETTAGEITLIDNQYGTTKTVHNGVIIAVYEPNFVIVGQHFESLEDIKFRQVIFRMHNLFQWLDRTGIDNDFNYSTNEYSIKYHKVNDILFNLNEHCNGNISIDSPVNFIDDNTKIEIKEQAYVTLNYTNKCDFNKILTDIHYIIGFITFITFEQSYPISITFKDEDFVEKNNNIEDLKFIKCSYKHSHYCTSHKLRRKHEHLVKYDDIQDSFPNILKNWYTKYKELEPVFILMLYSFKDKYRFSTEKFMDIVRALETFHCRTENNSKISKIDYKLKVKSILDSVDSSEHDFLNEILCFANEPRLRDRLNELLKKYDNSFLSTQIDDIDKFVQNTVRSRNYYTHYGKSLENKALKGKELFNLNQVLMGLLFSSILTYLELDKKHFEKGMKYLLGK